MTTSPSMRHISVTALALLAAGCVGEGSEVFPDAQPPDAPDAQVAADPEVGVAQACGDPRCALPAGYGRLDITWTVMNGAKVVGCPPGGSQAWVMTQWSPDCWPRSRPLPCYVVTTATPFVCGDGGGSLLLPPSAHVGGIVVTGPTVDPEDWLGGAEILGWSDGVDITVAAGEITTADFVVRTSLGSAAVSWTLRDSGGAPTTCDAVANGGMSVVLTNTVTDETIENISDCVDGAPPATTFTDVVANGDYDVKLTLLDAAGDALGESAGVPVTIDQWHVEVGTLVVDLF